MLVFVDVGHGCTIALVDIDAIDSIKSRVTGTHFRQSELPDFRCLAELAGLVPSLVARTAWTH